MRTPSYVRSGGPDRASREMRDTTNVQNFSDQENLEGNLASVAQGIQGLNLGTPACQSRNLRSLLKSPAAKFFDLEATVEKRRGAEATAHALEDDEEDDGTDSDAGGFVVPDDHVEYSAGAEPPEDDGDESQGSERAATAASDAPGSSVSALAHSPNDSTASGPTQASEKRQYALRSTTVRTRGGPRLTRGQMRALEDIRARRRGERGARRCFVLQSSSESEGGSDHDSEGRDEGSDAGAEEGARGGSEGWPGADAEHETQCTACDTSARTRTSSGADRAEASSATSSGVSVYGNALMGLDEPPNTVTVTRRHRPRPPRNSPDTQPSSSDERPGSRGSNKGSRLRRVGRNGSVRLSPLSLGDAMGSPGAATAGAHSQEASFGQPGSGISFRASELSFGNALGPRDDPSAHGDVGEVSSGLRAQGGDFSFSFGGGSRSGPAERNWVVGSGPLTSRLGSQSTGPGTGGSSGTDGTEEGSSEVAVETARGTQSGLESQEASMGAESASEELSGTLVGRGDGAGTWREESDGGSGDSSSGKDGAQDNVDGAASSGSPSTFGSTRRALSFQRGTSQASQAPSTASRTSHALANSPAAHAASPRAPSSTHPADAPATPQAMHPATPGSIPRTMVLSSPGLSLASAGGRSPLMSPQDSELSALAESPCVTSHAPGGSTTAQAAAGPFPSPPAPSALPPPASTWLGGDGAAGGDAMGPLHGCQHKHAAGGVSGGVTLAALSGEDWLREVLHETAHGARPDARAAGGGSTGVGSAVDAPVLEAGKRDRPLRELKLFVNDLLQGSGAVDGSDAASATDPKGGKASRGAKGKRGARAAQANTGATHEGLAATEGAQDEGRTGDGSVGGTHAPSQAPHGGAAVGAATEPKPGKRAGGGRRPRGKAEPGSHPATSHGAATTPTLAPVPTPTSASSRSPSPATLAAAAPHLAGTPLTAAEDRALLSEDPRGTSFVRCREVLARRLFLMFRRTVLDERISEDLELRWSPKLLTTAGRAHGKRRVAGLALRVDAHVELSTKVLDCYSRLRSVLAHELCHVAAFVVDQCFKPPHGTVFHKWGARFTRAYPDIQVTRCHAYEVHRPHSWECRGCGQVYSRHSKSIDVERHRCSVCRGQLSYRGVTRADGTPAKPRQATAYQRFQKEHFEAVKASLGPHATLGEVTREVARRWREAKEMGGGGAGAESAGGVEGAEGEGSVVGEESGVESDGGEGSEGSGAEGIERGMRAMGM